MKEEKKELIWVSKEFSEKWKKLEAEEATRETQNAVFDQYVKSVTDQVAKEFKVNLESLDEDAAIFTGLMLKVKQAFEKAKNEQLDASYALWEKFDAEIPLVSKKVASIVASLKPLKDELTEINALISKVNTHDIDRLNESVSTLAGTYGKHKEMIQFLIKNFNTQ